MAGEGQKDAVRLPEPRMTSAVSIEEALLKRRSVREYKNEALVLADVSQLVWAAQGTTDPVGLRTAPSAGALYPLELYVVAGRVQGLAAGVYQYQPRLHRLLRISGGDKRAELSRACFGQAWIEESAFIVVVAADYGRTTAKYGERGVMYAHMEAGHAAENLHLEAAALGLGTVVVGAFDDERVKKIVGMRAAEEPVCLMPIGRPS